LKRRGFDVSFMVNANAHVAEWLSREHFPYVTAESLTEIRGRLDEKEYDVAILIQLDTPEEEGLLFRQHARLLVTLDDCGPSGALADLRFNVLYPIEHALCDLRYVALSPVFQKKHALAKPVRERAAAILVTQGGSDTYGFTPKIVSALKDMPAGTEITVVLGPNFSHHRELDAALTQCVRPFNRITGMSDISDLMLRADLAVSAGGNTLFELACLGVPSVVVCGEPFEVATAKRLEQQGFGLALGFGGDVAEHDIATAVRHLLEDRDVRSRMSASGKALIDGLGASRMADRITEACGNGRASHHPS